MANQHVRSGGAGRSAAWVLLVGAVVACTTALTTACTTGGGASDGDWVVDGQGSESQHFSPLAQIADRNVGTLGLAWSLDLVSPMGLASEPIVVDGVIYVSLPQSRVYAVVASSGKVLWRFDPKVRLDRMRNSKS